MSTPVPAQRYAIRTVPRRQPDGRPVNRHYVEAITPDGNHAVLGRVTEAVDGTTGVWFVDGEPANYSHLVTADGEQTLPTVHEAMEQLVTIHQQLQERS